MDSNNPTPNSFPRMRQSFDFGWSFLKGDEPGAHLPAYTPIDWRLVDLPHDWSIEGPFSQSADSATFAHLPTGMGWYRKVFTLPQAYQGKKVVLEFDGVYQNSEVWVNGQFLGRRPYGYIGFAYDLTPHLHFDKENLIAVRVDNSRQPNCRWYSGSGIYRHTWVLVTEKLHIAQWGTFVTTPEVSSEGALVQVKTLVQNEGGAAAHCKLLTRMLDHEMNFIQGAESRIDIAAQAGYEFVQQFYVDKPRLWSPEGPYLYTLRSVLMDGERVVDSFDTPFGVRKIAFDVDQGFLLNDQPVKLRGVCLHHDGGCVGAAVPEGVWVRRLKLLKEMGCNSIRTSHNPYSPEFMDLCDRMGFLVMDEVFDEWRVAKAQTPDFGYRIYFDEWAERDATDFVRRDRNHPSVVLWSAGNEVGDQASPDGAQTLRRLLAVFRREDPTRLVTVGCDLIVAEPNAATPEFLEQLDVVGYNYVDRWRERAEKYYSLDRHAHPNWRFIGTESPAMGGLRGEYDELVPGRAGGDRGWWRRNRGIEVERLWRFVRTYDYVAGDYMWTGIDYLGEAPWPLKTAPAGVIDTCGFKKDGFYFYQSQWTERPMLHIFPHWTWPGKEGVTIPVMCYTNCDTVELFLNGKSLGVQGYWFPRYGMIENYGTFTPRNAPPRTTGDLHLTWTVPYQPGTLKAVGTKDGKVVVSQEIVTTGAPAALSVTADPLVIKADRRDVAHITVVVQDDQGRAVPVADNPLDFEIKGEARLIGVDNGNPFSDESFKASRRKAFNGLCLAVLQSTGKPGPVTISVTSPGLRTGQVMLKAL